MVVVEPGFAERIKESLKERSVRTLGFDRGSCSDAVDVDGALGRAIEALMAVAAPRGVYANAAVVEVEEDRVVTAAGAVRSAMFARLAAASGPERSVVFAVCTLGEGVDRLLAAQATLFKRSVMDAVASELAEIAADLADRHWQSEISAQGLESSARFSPGYCDWRLDGQAAVFGAVDARPAGVRLDAQFVMFPGKTISGVSLVARGVPASRPCVFCSLERCANRRPFEAASERERRSGPGTGHGT